MSATKLTGRGNLTKYWTIGMPSGWVLATDKKKKKLGCIKSTALGTLPR
jgi:hypothetical protein